MPIGLGLKAKFIPMALGSFQSFSNFRNHKIYDDFGLCNEHYKIMSIGKSLFFAILDKEITRRKLYLA